MTSKMDSPFYNVGFCKFKTIAQRSMHQMKIAKTKSAIIKNVLIDIEGLENMAKTAMTTEKLVSFFMSPQMRTVWS